MRILLVWLILCISHQLSAQNELRIGERIPYDQQLQLYNKPSTLLSLNKLKGENIIIDLFSSSCIVCFQMLPKINALQQEFAGKFRFLLLGQKDNRIVNTYQRFESKFQLNLDVIFDSIFFKKFSIPTMPTYIWIDSTGVIAAITGPNELTKENVSLFSKHGKLPFSEDVTPIAYTHSKPYLVNGNGGPDSNFLFRSLIGKWTPGLPYAIPAELKYNEARSFNAVGVSINNLYNLAYWGKLSWEIGDADNGNIWPLPIFYDEEGKQMPADDKTAYCYSAAYNGDVRPELSFLLRNDLHSYFGYDASIVTLPMPYYSVKVKKKGMLHSLEHVRRIEASHAGLDLQYVVFKQLLQRLVYYDTTRIPFVDESGIDYRVSIKIDAVLTDQQDFFGSLRKEGVIIERAIRPMKVLTLRKRKDVAVR